MDVPNEMGTKYSSGIFTVKAFLVVTVQKKENQNENVDTSLITTHGWVSFVILL